MAFVAPLGALLLSDLVLGFYPGMNFVYFSVALIVLIGWALQRGVRRCGSAAPRSPARSCSSS